MHRRLFRCSAALLERQNHEAKPAVLGSSAVKTRRVALVLTASAGWAACHLQMTYGMSHVVAHPPSMSSAGCPSSSTAMLHLFLSPPLTPRMLPLPPPTKVWRT